MCLDRGMNGADGALQGRVQVESLAYRDALDGFTLRLVQGKHIAEDATDCQ